MHDPTEVTNHIARTKWLTDTKRKASPRKIACPGNITCFLTYITRFLTSHPQVQHHKGYTKGLNQQLNSAHSSKPGDVLM